VYALDADNGTKTWNATVGSTRCSPAVEDGIVYAASNSGNVFADNASSGQALWNYTMIGHCISSPAVVEGVVYVGSEGGYLYCIVGPTVPHTPAPSPTPSPSIPEFPALVVFSPLILATAVIAAILRRKSKRSA
jgi:hypothetical protein